MSALEQSSANAPPAFGHAMRSYFSLDPQYINLNHGAFGSVPRPVLAACDAITAQVEANPDHFMWFTYFPLLAGVRAQLARLIGAAEDECVIVPNVSAGINTVLRNMEWQQGDVLVMTSSTFNTVAGAVRSVADTRPNPTLSEFPLQFPESRASLLDRFRAHLRALKAPSESDVASHVDIAASPRQIVAVLDSIVSTPGVLMPWREMVQICKEEGVWSVIDAAHSVGQEVGLDLQSAAPDFWVSNCSKWLYAKRGCAVLYVPKRNQHIIKTSLPTAVNYVSAAESKDAAAVPFASKFIWLGSADYAIPLSIKAAMDFRAFLGGEERINAYCRQLVLAGGRRLAEIMGTSLMDTSEGAEWTANMVNVELPLAASVKPSADITHVFQKKLLEEHHVYATQFFHNGKWWTRACAQVYNEISDFEKLGEALIVICADIMKS